MTKFDYKKWVIENKYGKLNHDANALAYAARTEKPFVSKHIATILADIENLIDATEMIDKIENRKDGDSGMFGPFFS